MLGILAATVFFLLFQICGLVYASALLKEKTLAFRLLCGSVLGSVLLQWLPALFAFLVGFSLTAQLLALGLVLLGAGLVWVRCGLKPRMLLAGRTRPDLRLLFLGLAIYAVFSALTLHGFRQADGAIYSSQCTFGDMSMHLGFITSIAEQQIFPPEYSILSGTPLAYPFLSDSISSSLYLLGAPLAFAYFLPMLFAGAQVVGGFMLFMGMWLKSRGKVFLSAVLFFFCGGFGFAYFFSGAQESPENFTRIFTAFYETPTNLVNENIRFVNVIVDMLVPQRATLFGWAVLFAALCLLFHGLEAQCRKCFFLTGLFAGALPMIHTHSFLVLALISAVWLLASLLERGCPGFRWEAVRWLLLAFPFVMALLQVILGNEREAPWLLYPPVLLLLGIVALAGYLLVMKRAARVVIPCWALYLGVTLLLSLPQLFAWTFQQAQGAQFTRGFFNWGNQNDNYLWFYVKNLGIPALLYLPAVLFCSRRMLRIAAPIFVIMLVSELIVFQPNTYDNNKLIYIAYFLLCGLASDYAVALYRQMKGLKGRGLLAAGGLALCTISAVLTIGREAVAEYRLFDRGQVQAAEFVLEETVPASVFLTASNHNNAVAALTGRNIVCGSASYVYYHGLDYEERQRDIAAMYEAPETAMELYRRYQVAYILVSSYELGRYAVDESAIGTLFSLVYENEGVRIYKTAIED